MRNRQSALMLTVPMDYSIDEPVNHADRLTVELTEKSGAKRTAALRRALPGETALLTDVEGHGWIEEGSKS